MLVAHPLLGKIFIFLDASVCSGASVTELEILTVFLNQYLVDFIVCAANCISSLVKNLFKSLAHLKKLSSLFKFRKLVIYSLLNM